MIVIHIMYKFNHKSIVKIDYLDSLQQFYAVSACVQGNEIVVSTDGQK